MNIINLKPAAIVHILAIAPLHILEGSTKMFVRVTKMSVLLRQQIERNINLI